MSALDTLLATQQGPNALGAFNQGIQNRDRNALSAFNLQQAPIVAGQQQQRAQQQIGLNEQKSQLNAQALSAGDEEKAIRTIQQTAALIGDVTDPQEFASLISTAFFMSDEEKQNVLKLGPDAVRQMNDNLNNVLNGGTAGQREFKSLTKGLSAADEEKARRIRLRLEPGAVGSALQSILDKGTAEEIGDVEAIIGEKKKLGEETGSSRARLVFKPQIEKAVTDARIKAQNDGEIFNELSQLQAALPNLTKAVDQLRDLSKVATSTFGGKAFDAVVKESGFGSTKGATARAKFIAIVNNQVLPLLKPTFGAAFTVPEGDALRATMGDPDATPESKMAQLDAFLDQKIRDIETKQFQLGQAQPQQQQQALPQGITEEDISETMRANSMTREQVLQRLVQ